VAMDAGFSALKAVAFAGAAGNGLSALIGAGFTGISLVEAYHAAPDLYQGDSVQKVLQKERVMVSGWK